MSNEPKWTYGEEEEYGYVESVKDKYYTLSIRSAKHICAELNRLESENAELRELLENVHGLRVDPVSRIATIQSTTPRTDADGFEKQIVDAFDYGFASGYDDAMESGATYQDGKDYYFNNFRKEGEQNGN